MTFAIDYERVREILEAERPRDPCESYYGQYEVEHEVLGALVPDTRALLQAAFAPDMHVVDIGCGRGDTLLDSAPLFRRGTGIDDSESAMLAVAVAERRRRGIENVEFVAGKGDALPFYDSVADLLFAERGPIGRRDATLVEALRVLRPGGLIFVETIGERNSWETVAAFDPNAREPVGWTENLELERDRFERHGIEVRTLASRVLTWRFPDFHEWLRYQCRTWNPPDREELTTDRRKEYERLIALASDDRGRISITQHTIWLAGRKPE